LEKESQRVPVEKPSENRLDLYSKFNNKMVATYDSY
jgi:hypothetical protein